MLLLNANGRERYLVTFPWLPRLRQSYVVSIISRSVSEYVGTAGNVGAALLELVDGRGLVFVDACLCEAFDNVSGTE